MKILTVIILLTFPLYYCNAQDTTVTRYLSKEGVTRLANNKFGSLVTGQSNSSNLINYASFNPVAGSFNFNGSLPIGKKGDSSRFSFLSLKISGDLISESYVALFQNVKLNTGISVSAQWDIQLTKGFHYTYLVSDEFNFNQRKQLITSQDNENNTKLTNQILSNPADSNLKRTQIRILDSALRRNRDTLAGIVDLLTSLQSAGRYNVDSVKLVYDSIIKQKARIEQLEKDRWISVSQLDSLRNVTTDYIGFTLATQRKIDDERERKMRLLEDSAAISGIRFNWISIFASTGRKDYYTFNPLEAFANQIKKPQSNPWKVGIMYNHYRERSFPRRVFLWNIGIFRYEDNNLSLLSTQDIVQQKVITNASGDTTRTISKTYKAYTDEVITLKAWNFVSNIYFLYSSRKSGFHIYPSVDIYDKGNTIANLGIGYLVSFKNTEKDKPIINTEGYIQFQDITNTQGVKKGFFRRNEIGVRFALPFTFFN